MLALPVRRSGESHQLREVSLVQHAAPAAGDHAQCQHGLAMADQEMVFQFRPVPMVFSFFSIKVRVSAEQRHKRGHFHASSIPPHASENRAGILLAHSPSVLSQRENGQSA